MLWWIRYALWKEMHRFCNTAYNSYTGQMVCHDDNSRFLYDDQPAARETEVRLQVGPLDAKGQPNVGPASDRYISQAKEAEQTLKDTLRRLT